MTTETVVGATFQLNEELPGRVEPFRVAEIRPQVSGIVQQRLFDQGTEVSAGQPLFQINPAPFLAEKENAAAALQRADAALVRAKIQTERLASLVSSDAISRQVYDDAVSQRDQALAEVAQAKAALKRRQLDLKFTKVEAPIAGRIDQALVTEGALVSSSDSNPMARIQQIDKVYVDVRRPAASLEALQHTLRQHGTKEENPLPVTLLRSNGEAFDTRGKVLFSGINVDAGTGDVLLRIQVDNHKRELLPGMFIRARVPVATYLDALTVPQQAVVRPGGKASLWTIDNQHLAHLIPIELGELLNHRYRIVSGLKKGQQIVVEGMERLIDGKPVTLSQPAATSALATH
ncbi:efflux RND transporter periplasmic adaptor subunit [Leeia sp. TBRC 13508]|uniref:Efflux RND transporter periplasmic adaptor subunit n=1 Tax=Leeia speluncae TaxID=2884804 RepID=A0ABS8D7M3_9NEIS|nr:efflux RND transporter periplasmic adaptor subunit [Leeia speluncae]MCB6184199.1 efflux RND transporter periplasmic adaptor subunit [Leeia speluncae]